VEEDSLLCFFCWDKDVDQIMLSSMGKGIIHRIIECLWEQVGHSIIMHGRLVTILDQLMEQNGDAILLDQLIE